MPSDLALRVRSLPGTQLPPLLDVALTAEALDEVATSVEALAASASNGNSPAT